MFLILPSTVSVYIALTLVLGFFMGGTFNMLASLELIKSSENDSTTVQMFSTLLMAVGSITVGVLDLIVGMLLDIKSHHNLNINGFFIAELAATLIALVLLMIKIKFYSPASVDKL